MSIHTRLEIWREQIPQKALLKVLSRSLDSPERSLLACWQREIETWTFPDPFQMYLDQLSGLWPRLEALGVGRDQLSFWAEGAYTGEETRIRLEALTLLSLSHEEIRLCLHFLEGRDFIRAAPSEVRLVAIRDFVVEPDMDNKDQARIWVGFDDGSFWSANLISFQGIQAQIKSQQGRGFIWAPYQIVAPDTGLLAAERAVVNLLAESQFERAFERQDACKAESEAPSRELSLRITEGQRIATEVEAMLGEGVGVSPQGTDLLWRFSGEAASGIAAADSLIQFVERRFNDLSQLGIRRHDLTLGWKEVYLQEANIDLTPEWLSRLGKSGLSLDLCARPATVDVVRTLEE